MNPQAGTDSPGRASWVDVGDRDSQCVFVMSVCGVSMSDGFQHLLGPLLADGRAFGTDYAMARVLAEELERDLVQWAWVAEIWVRMSMQ